ncbi:MAG TPA: alanine--tRNA ligase, partial [Fimbriimonas sp.]|nr:alanine--tRNA ligase [Fimbriimonas sp.]
VSAGDYSRDQWIADDEAKNWLEIWNDVFIQYEWQGVEGDSGWEKTGLPSLPFASIDTGMGLERTIAVLNGFKSVYETDAFSSIFAKIDSLREPLVQAGVAKGSTTEEGEVMAKRIIADHIRTACFCIADGVLPANNGRGYVLRRLIRRAVLKGQRTLGFDEPFMHKVAEAVFETFGGHYTELVERRETVVETLKSEEALFRRTLHRGTDLLLDHLGSRVEILDGDTAFQLYDTFGFPLEVTQELCAEAGIEVDLAGYKRAMEEAQERSRGAQGEKSAYGGLDEGSIESVDNAPDETTFLGYSDTAASATVVKVNSAKNLIALDQTPFYGESGGQVGDRGSITADSSVLTIKRTTKSAGTFWHEVDGSVASLLGKSVVAEIDRVARARTQRNHTATHLLQAALRQVVGTTVTQAGSYVGPDNLRFDFTHGSSLTQEQISEVEWLVNQEILANRDVTTYADLAIDEAKAKGAMALFGEKYGDKVRMVEIGDFSRELCGGTHVRTTGEIGLFKIVSESSAASGVRRIEAITGEAAYEFTREQSESIKTAANLLKTSPKDLVSAVERAMEQLKEERKKREKAEMAAMSGSGGSSATEDVNGITLWI